MDFTDPLVKKIFTWFDLHQEGAGRMNRLASELEEHKNFNIRQVVGSSVTVGGAVAVTVAGILTFFTVGAPLSLIVAAGAVALGLGVATSVGSTVVKIIKSNLSMKKAKQIGGQIENVVNEIEEHICMLINEWQKNQPQDDLHHHVVEQILRAMAKNLGLEINGHIKLSNMLMALNCGDAAGHLLKESGQCLSLLSQFVLQTISTAALKKAAKDAGKATAAATKGLATAVASAGATAVASGAVGLLLSVPDLIRSSTSLAENNATEAYQNLRDAASKTLGYSDEMKKELNQFRELLKLLCNLKNIIENIGRNDDDKELLIRLAIQHCRDEATRQWLREKSQSESFSKLVDMFFFLQKQIDEEEKKNHSNSVDITFLAHGSIEDQMIPASILLPLDSIHDVVLYSPWNCLLYTDAAYDIATGIMKPQNRVFCCSEEMHPPRKLPNEWNSMKKAGDKQIPNIMLSPLRLPEDGAWASFERLEERYGIPGRNHILIPFIIPEGTKYRIPFSVVSLALSLVLIFSRFQATLHLTACLGKAQQRMKLDEAALDEQYAYTMDNTGMKSSVDHSRRTNKSLYTSFQSLFGERSSGC